MIGMIIACCSVFALFVGFGVFIYENPTYDCDSPDFQWWKTCHKEVTEPIHQYGTMVIIFGIFSPIIPFLIFRAG